MANKGSKPIFELYIKELVKNIIREELKVILPEMISEYSVTPTLRESVDVAPRKPTIDRSKIADIMKATFSMEGDTLQPTGAPIGSAGTVTMMTPGGAVPIPKDMVDPEVMTAITKDYSGIMKAMGLGK